MLDSIRVPTTSLVQQVLQGTAVLERVLAGQAPAGFQTPAKAYGADFILEVKGIVREDVTSFAGIASVHTATSSLVIGLLGNSRGSW